MATPPDLPESVREDLLVRRVALPLVDQKVPDSNRCYSAEEATSDARTLFELHGKDHLHPSEKRRQHALSVRYEMVTGQSFEDALADAEDALDESGMEFVAPWLFPA